MSPVDISPIPRFSQHARYRGDKVALLYEGETFSFRRLHTEVGRLAAALAHGGVSRGDRVIFHGLNSSTFVITYLACAWIGAAFVPINYRLSSAEVVDMCHDSTPTVLISEPEHAAQLIPSFDQLPPLTALVVDTDPSLSAALAAAHLGDAPWHPLSEFIAVATEETPVPVALHEEDISTLLYTSGTTGRAKGVVLTHGNLWWNSLNVDSVVDTRTTDVYLAIAPLYHIGSLNTFTLRALTRGATSIIRRTFEPSQTVDDLVRYGVNGFFVVPAMLAAVQREPGFAEANLTALRSTIAAGAPVPPSLITAYADKGVYLQQAWGLTETSPFATYLETEMTLLKLGSAGIPMPHTEVQVVDPDTLRVITEPGDSGELWVRGPNVAGCYWNNPEASEKAFVEGGWFRSGDIGYFDTDGYLFIIDRLKDMVITGGENVYPAEVERVLTGHPQLTDIAVVGCPDPRWGEAVVAVISAPEEHTITLDDLRDFAADELARYKLPTKMLRLESIPRNGAGKLDKPTIRELVATSILTGR
ncbi:long-chain fatty acid--CoA ligase [Klugiella xanthotipulae]|uniref:Fatty-acyl-CoA synthase n=1 Tax=Klugiella xanthotipulae TaxID=244735 RepID=A0A543I466_9MICO|nr:AMP-binding protein [Klugiella xanthotipulae]TQM65382.1 fatty-acyl-CoA synthase [Klugiella xanthotipulae]